MLVWLESAQRRLQESFPDSGPFTLSPADIEALLELAKAAAHESGDRTNAPLVSYLVGLAHGRATDATLPGLIQVALGTRSGG